MKKLHRALLKALHPDKIAAPAGESEEERERRVRDVVNPRFHALDDAWSAWKAGAGRAGGHRVAFSGQGTFKAFATVSRPDVQDV